jgi:hypothetical protein
MAISTPSSRLVVSVGMVRYQALGIGMRPTLVYGVLTATVVGV